MPGDSSISASTRSSCFWVRTKRIHVLHRLHLGVLRGRGARDRDQGLAGGIGHEMQMEVAAGALRHWMATGKPVEFLGAAWPDSGADASIGRLVTWLSVHTAAGGRTIRARAWVSGEM